jgi:fatty-acyl-CoA synthase
MEASMSSFIKKTIGDVIREQAERQPNHEALVFPEFNIRQNYRELYETSRSVAKGFMALGVQKGDHVSVWTTNLPEWVYLQFGLGMIGAVLVTFNTNYKSHELEYILNQSDSIALVLMEGYRDTNYFDIVNSVMPELSRSMPVSLSSSKLPMM